MSLFGSPKPVASATELQQLKAWVSEALAVEPTTPISISQLRCAEPGCPPVETVIAVMVQPPKTYKIHSPIQDLARQDVFRALGKSS